MKFVKNEKTGTAVNVDDVEYQQHLRERHKSKEIKRLNDRISRLETKMDKLVKQVAERA